MKNIFAKRDKRSDLEKERDNAVLVLRTFQVGTNEYNTVLEQVERLNDMVMAEKDHGPKPVSWDTVTTCATQLASIGAILKHEDLKNITSKAMNFVIKGRVR